MGEHAPRLEVRLLWIATLAAMAASWSHLVSWIASWEYAGASAWVIAAIGATAVDLGILASMRSLDALATRGCDTTGPRRTVYALALASFAANVLHALDARASRVGPLPDDADWTAVAVRVAGAVLAAGVLPLIVIRLTHLLDTMTRLDAPSVAPAVAQGVTQERCQTRRSTRTSTMQARDAETRDAAPAPASADAVCDAARRAPHASRRELARLARVSDATVRRLERAGALTWTDAGWSVAA